MYSKAKGIKDRDAVTPPPGYDGNRFNRIREFEDPFFNDTPPMPTKSTFPTESNKPSGQPDDRFSDMPYSPSTCGKTGALSAEPLHASPSFFCNAGKEELLLIALILILAEEKGSENKDALLILVLLLCC